jgi:hypothetical protein
MSRSPKVNYFLRPNKNVERKLVVDALRRLGDVLNWADYRYLGMGSMWYIDFRLVHQALGITAMTSMELPELSERAAFNLPFACIDVLAGESRVLLPELSLGSGRYLIWLDHEGGLQQGVLEDAVIVAEQVGTDSVFLMTLNADRRFLDDGGRGQVHSQRLDRLREIVGAAIPADVPPERLSHRGFSSLVAEIALNMIGHAVARSGRPEAFIPLFNLAYRDAAPMVTVGGVFASARTQDLVRESSILDLDYVATGTRTFEIDVPHLTPREKLAIDRLLPCETELLEDEVRRSLAFSPSQAELSSYQRYYLQYPLFAELLG